MENFLIHFFVCEMLNKYFYFFLSDNLKWNALTLWRKFDYCSVCFNWRVWIFKVGVDLHGIAPLLMFDWIGRGLGGFFNSEFSWEVSKFRYFFWTVRISLFFLNCQNFTIFRNCQNFTIFRNCQNFTLFSELSKFHYFFGTVKISLFFLNCQNFTIFSELSEFHFFQVKIAIPPNPCFNHNLISNYRLQHAT